MTRIDAAREAAGKTREQLAPYAVSARDAAAHYTDEAWQRLAPRIESAVEQARAAASAAQQAAQSTVDGKVAPRVAPLWEQARDHVPPAVEDAVGEAARRTRRAARSARRSAAAAALQARETAGPAVAHAWDEAALAAAQAAQLAHDRGAAALPVLRGQVSLAEIEALTAEHGRSRRSRRLRRFLVLAGLGAVAGGGLAAWKWWQKQSNPDWLVEPPSSSLPLRSTPATAAHGSTVSSPVASTTPVSSVDTEDSIMPLAPDVEAKAAAEADAEGYADQVDGTGTDDPADNGNPRRKKKA